jgi:hypothetical protein
MQRYMLIAILPIWAAAGISDYVWHKRTQIETTSGTEESVTHALMMIEMAPAILAGLFLEINAGTLALMMAASVVHEATVLWDVSYAIDKRVIPPGEQHTHSYLETIPWSLVMFAAFTHWEQLLALLGLGPEVPRLAFRLRSPPLSAPSAVSLLGAIGLLVGLPHAEELWRCWKAQKQGLLGRDTPPCTRELFRQEGRIEEHPETVKQGRVR